DYLPVDEARKLGATYVIAIDALRPQKMTGNMNAITLADRSVRLLLQRSRTGKSSPDLLVVPDLNPDLTPLEYPVDPTPLLQAGRPATPRDVPPASASRGSAGSPTSAGEPPSSAESPAPTPAPNEEGIGEPPDTTAAPLDSTAAPPPPPTPQRAGTPKPD